MSPAPPNRLNSFLLWLVACPAHPGKCPTFSLLLSVLESSSDDPMPVSSQSAAAGPLEASGASLSPELQGHSCSAFPLQPGPPRPAHIAHVFDFSSWDQVSKPPSLRDPLYHSPWGLSERQALSPMGGEATLTLC